MTETDGNTGAMNLALGALSGAVSQRLEGWKEEGFADRLWRQDPTLWAREPLPPELVDRLGWLSLPFRMAPGSGELAAIEGFAREVRAARIERVVLLGMGGSSLAPEVFQTVFGYRMGFPRLTVLDSTHPAAVRAVEQGCDPRRTLFLVASKSGSTVETLSLFRYFWRWVETTCPGRETGEHFAAITDPGSGLSALARERGFRALFEAPPDVGGRYSALSEFGLVGAAVAGADPGKLVAAARRAAEGSFSAAAPDNPALFLGAALGEAALAGRDKLTFFTSPALATLPVWIEQLVAESSGKAGAGIVPVVDEPVWTLGEEGGLPRAPYGDDRFFVRLSLGGATEREGVGELLSGLEENGHPVVRLHLADRQDLGAQMLLWEIATAAAGAVLGQNPFDQPDVELAKRRAKEALTEDGAGPSPDSDDGALPVGSDALPETLESWLADARAPRYLAIQAFLMQSMATDEALAGLRRLVTESTGVTTTVGYGPRFLHSTGQLHKGGPDSGLFLQLVDRPAEALPIPETETDFRSLIRAQAVGDARALEERGRPVLRIDLGADPLVGLERLERVLRALG